MKAKMTIGQRVSAARKERGWNQSELARAAGISQPTVSAIESNTTTAKDIKMETLVRIAAATRKPLSYFVGEGGELFDIRPHLNAEPVNEKFHSRLPLISFVQAGARGDANDPYHPGAAEEWIDFMGTASVSAFCLRVRGQSMVRADGTGFPEGCLIAIEPTRKPRSGDFVVVRFNDSDEATFKQYFVEGPIRLLKPLNPEFPTLTVTPDAQLVGVVFEKRVIERF